MLSRGALPLWVASGGSDTQGSEPGASRNQTVLAFPELAEVVESYAATLRPAEG
ncbi:hypothetical protein GCM10027569_29690 [Flindersiella endophytica]